MGGFFVSDFFSNQLFPVPVDTHVKDFKFCPTLVCLFALIIDGSQVRQKKYVLEMRGHLLVCGYQPDSPRNRFCEDDVSSWILKPLIFIIYYYYYYYFHSLLLQVYWVGPCLGALLSLPLIRKLQQEKTVKTKAE